MRGSGLRAIVCRRTYCACGNAPVGEQKRDGARGLGFGQASGAFVQDGEALEQPHIGGRVVDRFAEDDARLRIRAAPFQQVRELHGEIAVRDVGGAEEALADAVPEHFFERFVVVRGAPIVPANGNRFFVG